MIRKFMLEKKIVQHKKTIASLYHNNLNLNDFKIVAKELGKLKRQYSEISLVVAEFKCQKCGRETELQYHHLIPRIAKFFVDKMRYISSRFYWSNVIILCKNCHSKYHKFHTSDTMFINQNFIDKLKEKYLLK